jgi:hypothetical protein
MSVLIVRAFVKLREMIATHKDLARKIDILYQGIDAGFLLVACCYQERKREKHKQTDEERANVLLFTCCYKEVCRT